MASDALSNAPSLCPHCTAEIIHGTCDCATLPGGDDVAKLRAKAIQARALEAEVESLRAERDEAVGRANENARMALGWLCRIYAAWSREGWEDSEPFDVVIDGLNALLDNAEAPIEKRAEIAAAFITEGAAIYDPAFLARLDGQREGSDG